MLSKKVCKFENLKMPPKILLNLTTGLEEGKAAYCRGLHGIFLPRNMVEWATENFAEEERLVSHELWHIISRNLEPAVRDEVYRVINYLPFGHRLDYPPLLKVMLGRGEGGNFANVVALCKLIYRSERFQTRTLPLWNTT